VGNKLVVPFPKNPQPILKLSGLTLLFSVRTNAPHRTVARLMIMGGRFAEILDLFQGLKIGVPSGCL